MKTRITWLLLPAFVVACRMSMDLNTPTVQGPPLRTMAGILGQSNCTKTSIPGLTSIPQLGTGTYQGQQGGLYPGGSNTIPAAHLNLGLTLSSQVQPRDAAGGVDLVNGKVVQISFGGSTAVRVFAGDSAGVPGVLQNAFKPFADVDPGKSPHMEIVNTAQANKPLKNWLDPSDSAWIVIDERLAAAGVTPAQVQVGWFMVAEGRPPVFGFPQDARNFRDSMEVVIRFAKSRYPNMRLAFLSPHYYQGYRPTNIEPNNYEQGFGLKWMVEDQINGQPYMNADPAQGAVVAPWVGWATHLWTNGIIPNNEGLFFVCAEFDSNGIHLVRAGVDKAGPRLESFFMTDATTRAWFANNTGQVGDFVWDDTNGNGIQDVSEPGIAGVTVTLTGPGVSRTTTTDAGGQYLFTELPAGNYSVSVTTPSGFVLTTTNAPGSNGGNDSNGNPAAVSLATNTTVKVTIDIGFTRGTGVIGDFVWDDQNGDGIQDAGEPGLAGVTVTLSGATNAVATTDASGKYTFGNLFAGAYTVTVATPSGYSASPSNQGGDSLKDSNGNPATVTLATNSTS
ncbi:MAG: SdrD B-like domain-containing protein, partial [Gemmatimonadaceae bacterium]